VELVLIGLLLVGVAVVAVARRDRRQRSSTVEVVADAIGVRRVLADGRRETVTWPEVVEVDVFTTRIGPHAASGGAVVLYGDAERGCIVPLDRLAESHLLEHAHRLPGFDSSKVLAAVEEPSESTGPRALLTPRPRHRTTVCWRREET
jgi:hypothetical protein